MTDEGDGSGEFTDLADLPPGPRLGAVLARVDVEALGAHELVILAKAWQRQKAFADSCQVQVLAALSECDEYQRCSCPGDAEVPHTHRAVEPAGDEVSLALAWSSGRAKNSVATAIELVEDLPDTLVALREGRVEYDKARLIAERTRCLGAVQTRRRVEAAVLGKAERLTRRQLDHLLRREVVAADPEAAEQRRREAARGRWVSRPEPASDGAEDGMAFLGIHGPAEDLAALWTAIDAAARHARTNGNERTLDQLRFDTLTSLGWTGLDLGHLGCCSASCVDTFAETVNGTTSGAGAYPAETGAGYGGDGRPGRAVLWLGRVHGKAAAVNVTVAAASLFGADEQPGWLDGFGPITADASRRISTKGPWRRLLTDSAHGGLLEYGRYTYAPPAELAAFVIARDRTCRFVTCERPAREADIDHRNPYQNGGTTGAINMWALHRGHHLTKTFHGFQADADPSGSTWWTTPAGHHYRVYPEAIGPIIKSRVAVERSTNPPQAAEQPPY